MVLDFETSENGKGSTEFYRLAFRADTMAASWLTQEGAVKSEYFEGENAIELFLQRLARQNIPIVAHNAQFEAGVLACRFGRVSKDLVWHADTMRLAQVYDNGGDKFAVETLPTYDDELGAFLTDEGEGESDDKPKKKAAKPKGIAGLGLVKCAKRILDLPDHKEEAHEWIRANVPECKTGKEGQFLSRLPHDIAYRYNVADTEVTLKIYTHCIETFRAIGYDWTIDHRFYFNSLRLLVESKIRGVPVKRERLEEYRSATAAEIERMGSDFRSTFEAQISICERLRLKKQLGERKTLRGRKAYVRRYRAGSPKTVAEVRFNVGSNTQLQALFVNQLGMRAKFVTAKGAPAFRSAVLHQWGDGGTMLAKRRKRLLVLKQCESLLALTAHDGRWHIDLKACGTSTGRYSGGQH